MFWFTGHVCLCEPDTLKHDISRFLSKMSNAPRCCRRRPPDDHSLFLRLLHNATATASLSPTTIYNSWRHLSWQSTYSYCSKTHACLTFKGRGDFVLHCCIFCLKISFILWVLGSLLYSGAWLKMWKKRRILRRPCYLPVNWRRLFVVDLWHVCLLIRHKGNFERHFNERVKRSD